ncbi:hypothetical protein C6B37_01550 [Candidatus Phytoplasma phoenicium]|uniref:ABC transmembrane type-1 domain-containing protein n=1 Tax=Candidatus Phytoplasma phoenicium TaxID=198422 RepID=A0A2S8NUF2_9MOLU|nr:hypothetical protein C6B37_01550 [Candidatus Phytoplasma phoenicium]
MNKSYIIALKKIWKKNKNLFKIGILILFLILTHISLLHHNFSEPKKIMNSTDTIKLGTVKSIPPFVFATKNNNNYTIKSSNSEEPLSGFDILLFREIAEKLDKELDVKVYDLSGLVNDLKLGNVDAIIGSLDETKDRKDEFDSIPYAQNELGILFKKENNDLSLQNENDKIEINLKDLQKKDKIEWLTVLYSSHDREEKTKLIQKKNEKMKKKTCFETLEQCISVVNDGNADCVIFDYPLLKNYADSVIHKNRFQVLKLKDDDLKLGNLSIFLKKNSQLTPRIKEYLGATTNNEQKLLSINEKNKFYNQAKEVLQLNEQTNEQNKNKNIFQKILVQLPNYKKSFFITLLLAVESLLLGFGLSLVFFRIIVSTKEQQTGMVFYLKQFAAKTIGIFNYLFKAIPLAIVILFLYNCFSFCGVKFFSEGAKGPFYLSLIVCSFNTAFILNNNMINNYKFLDKGQIEAAYVLGMNSQQVFKEIIFNQILQRIMPSLRNQFIFNIKDTAFFSIIGLNNLLWIANRNISATYDIITPLIIISCIYLFLVFLSEILAKFNFKKIYIFFIHQNKKLFNVFRKNQKRIEK